MHRKTTVHITKVRTVNIPRVKGRLQLGRGKPSGSWGAGAFHFMTMVSIKIHVT